MSAINEMRQDPTSERELQQLKVKVDRWWSNPHRWQEHLVLDDQEVSTLHELMFAAGIHEPTKGPTDG